MKSLLLAFALCCSCVPHASLRNSLSLTNSSSISGYVALEGEVNEDSTKVVADAIHQAERDGTPITIELNTPGGSVPDGFQLAKVIERATVPITCVVDGDAASMGFYILQSCPVRIMTKRSSLMAHEPSMGGQFRGTPNEWAAMAAWVRAMREGLAQHCNHRLTTTIAEYHARTDGNQMWWFTAEEALAFHAVDRVVDAYRP